MMGHRRLRQPDPFLDIPSTETRSLPRFVSARFGRNPSLLQCLQDSASGWIGYGVESFIEGSIGG